MTAEKKGRGGARPGAGRKPKPKEETVLVAPYGALETDSDDSGGQAQVEGGSDTLKLLQDVAFGRIEVTSLQLRAAIAAVQYTHTKRADGGKKDETAKKAKEAASKFTQAAPPKLVAAGGKKV